MQQITFRAMGCQMMAALDSPYPGDQAQLEAVPGWFETWEQHLSRFRPNSELSRVNQGVDMQPISSVLAQVVRAALVAQRQSDGLVNPLLLNALEAAGYNRNFTDLPEEINDPDDLPPLTENWQLELDFDNRKLTLPPGARLDLGGIAKGWAADRAARRLGALAPALVDAGGDVAVSGPQADGTPWPVGVANPLDPTDQIDLLALWEGGVATSGRDYRRWRKDGRWMYYSLAGKNASKSARMPLNIKSLQGGEDISVHLLPIPGIIGVVQFLLNPFSDLVGLIDVGRIEFDTGYGITHIEESLSLSEADVS